MVGLVWHATGWPLPGVLDETLQLLGTAVAPISTRHSGEIGRAHV